MIKDSGKREEFKTGAVRDSQEGRGRCDLLPLDCLPGKYTTDPLIVLLNEFKKYGKVSFIENARQYFIHHAFPNTETSLLELSIHYQDGAKKYGDNNWQKGLPVSRYLSSAIRHYLKFCRGDKDEPHDRACLWNLTAIIWTCKHKPELNDYATKAVTTKNDIKLEGLHTKTALFDELHKFPYNNPVQSPITEKPRLGDALQSISAVLPSEPWAQFFYESLKDTLEAAKKAGMTPNEYLKSRKELMVCMAPKGLKWPACTYQPNIANGSPDQVTFGADIKPPIDSKKLPKVQIIYVGTPTTRDYEEREKLFADMVSFLAEPLKPEIKGGVK